MRPPTRRCLTLILIFLLTFGSLELSLRWLTPFSPQPLKSLLSESAQHSFSNRRLHGTWKNGTAILLPPIETKDVLFVGDSFPFGSYVKEENTFPVRFETLTGRTIVNLGVPATGLGSYNRMLEVGHSYHPRQVFYCIFSNDFSDEGPPPSRPLFIANGTKSLPGDSRLFLRKLSLRQQAKDAIKQIIHASLAYRLFNQWLHAGSFHSLPTFWEKHFFLFAHKDFADRVLQDPAAEIRLEAVAELIREAHKFTSHWPSQFTVVLLPPKEFVYGPLLGEAGKLMYEDAHYRRFQKLMRLLDASKISYIDTTPFLRKRAAEKVKLYFSIDGHFSEEGHNAVSELLATYPLISSISTRGFLKSFP